MGLKEIINFFDYIYPGFIFLFIYYKCVGYGFKFNTNMLITDIIISIVICSLTDIMLSFFNLNYSMINSLRNIIIIFISAISPIVFNCLRGKVIHDKSIRKFLDDIGIWGDFLEDEFEYLKNNENMYDKNNKNFCFLKIHVKNNDNIYYGFLSNHEKDMTKRNYIILSRYMVVNKKTKEIIHCFLHKEAKKYNIIIYLDSVDLIEQYSYCDVLEEIEEIEKYYEELDEKQKINH